MASNRLVRCRSAAALLSTSLVLAATTPGAAEEGCLVQRGSELVAHIGPIAASGRLVASLQRGNWDTRPGIRVSVMEPSGMVGAGRWEAIWYVHDIALNADTAIAAADNGLVSLDLSDPLYPLELDFIDLLDADHLAIDGGVAYLTSDFYGGRNWFTVVDVSEPTDLREQGSLFWDLPYPLEPCWSMNAIDASDEIAVISLDCGLIIVDVSDPWQPAKRGEWYRFGVLDVALVDDLAAVAIDRSGGDPEDVGVEFVDLSNPDQPTSIGFWTAPSAVRSVAEYGGALIAGTESDGIFLLDIGDPTHPIVLEHWPAPELNVEHLATAWPTIALTDSESHAVVLSLDPSCMPPRTPSGRVGR